MKRELATTLGELKKTDYTSRTIQLELAENLVEEGGVCLLMKGQSYLDELADARKAWSFECEVIKSQTNAAAAVLKIRNIQRAAQ